MRVALILAAIASAQVVLALPAHANGNLVYVQGSVIQYVGGAGYVNNLTVRTSGGVYIFDENAGVQAGAGCFYPSTSDLSVVHCPITVVSWVKIDVNTMNDRVDYWGEAKAQIYGGPGNDELWGGDSDDSLYGGGDNDRLFGWNGDDFLDGGTGADQMAGQAGIEDKVSYESHPAGVTADLDGAAGDDGMPGEGDTIGADVEYLNGSPFNDVLTGSAVRNILWGCAGNDVLSGLGGDDWLAGDCESGTRGADLLMGGDGSDWVTYYTHAVRVEASLDGVSGNDGAIGEGDTIAADIENISGGLGDDKITGNAMANRLDGHIGNDTLYGLDGNDVLMGNWGWRGPLPGTDDDWLYGGNGADELEGADGFDHCDVGPGGLSTVTCEA
jgi:Ca2+-binding RTX toxin-like protein